MVEAEIEMNDVAQITVLVENTAQDRGLLAEHGIAFWIQIGSQCVLFDTGQGLVLMSNAFRLGIQLADVDAIVLSHGHYDHTGGLNDLLRGNRSADVYVHPDALKAKYARNEDGTCQEIGVPPNIDETLLRRRKQLVPTDKPTALPNGLMVTGPIPRSTDFEDTGGPFFHDPEFQQPDLLWDDQSVFFDTAQGTVVLLGCAHAGVINTLRYVRQLTGQRALHAVLGGMHLAGAPPERIRRTIEEFRELDIAYFGPAHCTGRVATAALWDAFPDRCVSCHVGSRFEFELLKDLAPETASWSEARI
jgi:7,8-dihydropterin-6-yl-methyl-4-(beta-D-ribofuranosyl)aminobenzene 5'-phosphate synthase